jgi:hypothetical protein
VLEEERRKEKRKRKRKEPCLFVIDLIFLCSFLFN